MIGIGSIEALTDLSALAQKPTKARNDEKRSAKSDTVEVSTDAQKAADAARLAAASDSGSEIRKEAVEAARKRIEEGAYRIQNMVHLVAARVTQYV